MAMGWDGDGERVIYLQGRCELIFLRDGTGTNFKKIKKYAGAGGAGVGYDFFKKNCTKLERVLFR